MSEHLLAQVPGKAIELGNFFFRAQPSELAFGELARRGDALLAPRGESDFAV